MTLIGWIFTFVIGIVLGFVLTVFVGFLINKFIYKGEFENKETKTADTILLLIFILSATFITYSMYVEEVESKYEVLETLKADYDIYAYSLKDEKLFGEWRYEVINDVRMYNKRVLNYQSIGYDIIGHPDLKSKIAALKLINLE